MCNTTAYFYHTYRHTCTLTAVNQGQETNDATNTMLRELHAFSPVEEDVATGANMAATGAGPTMNESIQQLPGRRDHPVPHVCMRVCVYVCMYVCMY
jgi:hypothetical protein